jgi:hypothetical protein
VSKSPEKELEEFLASKPAWMRRVLQEDFSSFLPDELLEWINNQDKVFELNRECEHILRKIPARWEDYRRRRKQNSRPLVQMLVQKGRSGRPRKDSEAEEYAALHLSTSYSEIAKQRLKDVPITGAKKREAVKKKADSIRHLVNSRHRRNRTPNKT